MAHYFNDMFQRSIDMGTPRSPGMPRARRSSTAWSIGARSDFEASVNGFDDDPAQPGDQSRARERAEADSHLHRYISDQLSRYKDQDGDFQHEDEFEARA